MLDLNNCHPERRHDEAVVPMSFDLRREGSAFCRVHEDGDEQQIRHSASQIAKGETTFRGGVWDDSSYTSGMTVTKIHVAHPS